MLKLILKLLLSFLDRFRSLVVISLRSLSRPDNRQPTKRRNTQGKQKRKHDLRPLDACHQHMIHSWALGLEAVTIAHRHAAATALDLYELERSTSENTVAYKLESSVICYGCNRSFRKCHPVYFLSCRKCGDKFQRFRNMTRDLIGKTALVIGARTKLGHQIVVKLLDAGATVIGTTRYPEKALELFSQYPKWQEWRPRLRFFPKSLDLDSHDLANILARLRTFILGHGHCVDILINSAAQTIRSREKTLIDRDVLAESNRYGSDKFVPEDVCNSWHQRLADIRQDEMEEVYRVNAIAPALILQTILPLLQASDGHPYVVNVHAREGLFQVGKNDQHVHTNMAKAALAMLTRCMAESNYRTSGGAKIWFHGIDPGWISIDEYHESSSPVIVPPLDEIDGAARILYPVMANLPGSYRSTRRHFNVFKT